MDSSTLVLIICGAGVIQSLFLSVYILTTTNIQPQERLLLGSLLLAITLRLSKSIGWYFFGIEDPIFLNLGFAAHGFIGPILAIYFARKSDLLKRKIHQLMILAPAIVLLCASPFLSLGGFWYSGGYHALLYYTILMLGVAVYFLRVIYREKKIYFHWYRNLFIGIAIFCISYFTNYIFGLNSYISGSILYAIIIYVISFIMFSNHEIFTPLGDKKKYKNINLSDDQIASHHEKIANTMLSQKPYLQSDFSLTQLSQLTSIPKHLLSWFLNEEMNQSFTDFTNNYRVEKAKELLVDKKSLNHKIAFVAYECGFNSLSSFNAAFKKIVAKSPSEYRKVFLDN